MGGRIALCRLVIAASVLLSNLSPAHARVPQALLSALPDLVEILISDPPSTIAPGETLQASDTVENQGDSDTSSEYNTTRYYLSLDAIQSSDDVILGDLTAWGVLSPGDTKTETGNFTVPSSTPNGSYYLIACADVYNSIPESNEGNNCIASTGKVHVSLSPLPDFVVIFISDPPSTIAPGGTFQASDTVENQGNSDTSAYSTTRYYLSLDAIQSSDDVILGDLTAWGVLSPGDTKTETGNFTVPGSTPNGSYYLIACADIYNATPESNEGNNCIVSGTRVRVKRHGSIVAAFQLLLQ